MTPRTAEAFISYRTFSITETPVILRVVEAPTPTVGYAPRLGDI